MWNNKLAFLMDPSRRIYFAILCLQQSWIKVSDKLILLSGTILSQDYLCQKKNNDKRGRYLLFKNPTRKSKKNKMEKQDISPQGKNCGFSLLFDLSKHILILFNG